MSTVRVIEICHVAPSPPLPDSDFSQPLTFFDSFFLKFAPVEYIYLYRSPTVATSPSDVIVPRLKHSLSLALAHFLPLAGKLTWPENAQIPFLLYTPQNDGVSLTIAESADGSAFDELSGDGPHDVNLSRAYVPKLHVSGSDAAVLALQVTVFPSRGFCVGVTYHHGVLDGKCSAMFMKAWAHISMELGNGNSDGGELMEALMPFVDRTVVKDPDGIALEDFKTWIAVNKSGDPRSLEMMPETVPAGINKVRRTFKLSRQDINKLKKIVQQYQLETSDHYHGNSNHQPTIDPSRLSSFVVIFAHTLVCMAKAKKEADDDGKLVKFGIPADCRSRLDPSLPSNYFGCCVTIALAPVMKTGDLVHHGGIARVARMTIETIKKLDHDVLDGAKGKLGWIFGQSTAAEKEEVLMIVGIAGSPRLGVYDVDFGFGRPEKVEITSIDRGTGMSMLESRDGIGGVEVGLVMLRHEMDKFTSSFFDGLKDI